MSWWRVLWVWIWRGEILDDRVSDRWRLEHARLSMKDLPPAVSWDWETFKRRGRHE